MTLCLSNVASQILARVTFRLRLSARFIGPTNGRQCTNRILFVFCLFFFRFRQKLGSLLLGPIGRYLKGLDVWTRMERVSGVKVEAVDNSPIFIECFEAGLHVC